MNLKADATTATRIQNFTVSHAVSSSIGHKIQRPIEKHELFIDNLARLFDNKTSKFITGGPRDGLQFFPT